MILAVPADFDIRTLDRIRSFNTAHSESGDTIAEVYGSLPTSGFPAGRSSPAMPQVSNSRFAAYVRKAYSLDVTFTYTLNGSCLGAGEYSQSWRNRLYALLEYLHSIGIQSFTVASPALVAIVREVLPTATITASVIADVSTRHGAEEYLRLGATRIMASVSLHRRFQQIRQLTAVPNTQVGMILNSFCLPDCTYRASHFNTSAHLSEGTPHLYEEIGSFDFNRCALTKLSRPVEFIRAVWIRPEDVRHYEDAGIAFFKLEGRQRPGFDALRTAAIYCKRQYRGNLCDLHCLFSEASLPSLIHIDNSQLDGFIHNFLSAFPCDLTTCDQCGYCAQYATRAVRISDQQALDAALARVRGELSALTEYRRP